ILSCWYLLDRLNNMQRRVDHTQIPAPAKLDSPRRRVDGRSDCHAQASRSPLLSAGQEHLTSNLGFGLATLSRIARYEAVGTLLVMSNTPGNLPRGAFSLAILLIAAAPFGSRAHGQTHASQPTLPQ